MKLSINRLYLCVRERDKAMLHKVVNVSYWLTYFLLIHKLIAVLVFLFINDFIPAFFGVKFSSRVNIFRR